MGEPVEDRLDGLAAEVFSVDSLHSHVGFDVAFFGFNRVPGSFTDYDATILYVEDDLSRSRVVARIDVASIDTRFERRDDHLRSSDFFDADVHPYITFRSTSIEPLGTPTERATHLLRGELTMHGITREVTLPFRRVLERTPDGWRNVRIGFSASLTLNRRDFDITGGDWWGEQVLGDDVDIELNLLALVSNYGLWGWRAAEGETSIGEVVYDVAREQGIEAALGRYRDAVASGDESLDLDDEGALTVAALKLAQEGEPEAALRLLRLNVEQHPEYPRAWGALGRALAMLGERREAIAAYERLIELEPTSTEAIAVLGWLRDGGRIADTEIPAPEE